MTVCRAVLIIAAADALSSTPLRLLKPRYRLHSVTMSMRAHNALRLVGESARFTVSGAVATTLIVRHDLATLEWVCGAICAAILNKILKRIIKQARPEGSVEVGDDGMPSSHACAMTNIAVSVLDGQAWPAYAAVGTYVTTALTWRYVANYHTLPQLLVGAIVGGGTSVAWRNWQPLTQIFHAMRIDDTGAPIALISAVLVIGALVVGSLERRQFMAAAEASDRNKLSAD